ncbi:MAG: hypothetical protein FJ027_23485 [Candidatus Rokubacteria bacterium]|nr:hypothetical protein [Candidatus Rokubacteria bacterium]
MLRTLLHPLTPPRVSRSLRPYVATDAGTCAAMLTREGLTPEDMAFDRLPTVVLEEGVSAIGFATLEMAHGRPHVVHFVIDRPCRTAARARCLMRGIRVMARDAGFSTLILHACTDPVRRLIEYYFRARPYITVDGRTYYEVIA